MQMPKEPEKEVVVTISIRLPEALHADVDALAKSEDRSISAVGVRAFRAYVEAARAVAQRKTRAAG